MHCCKLFIFVLKLPLLLKDYELFGACGILLRLNNSTELPEGVFTSPFFIGNEVCTELRIVQLLLFGFQ
jgi:hypothetical protein